MRIYLITLLSIFVTFNMFSQNIYFGYPENNDILKKGDILVFNVPDNMNGRFNKIEDLDGLIGLISSDLSIKFKIEINIFLGSADLNLKYSEHLCNNLRKILNNADMHNFELKFNGSTNPIFLDKSSKNYKFYNTRLEIFLGD